MHTKEMQQNFILFYFHFTYAVYLHAKKISFVKKKLNLQVMHDS